LEVVRAGAVAAAMGGAREEVKAAVTEVATEAGMVEERSRSEC
jgi:hypothetical protein